MRVHIDTDRCQGHGRCYDIAPALFGEDENGYATLATEGRVSPDQADDAELAAANCPETAITVEEA
jgi:ferredoxin